MGEEDTIYPSKNMNYPPRGYASQSYALSGKIMLSAIVILFTVVFLIICFHIYARCFLIRNRQRLNNRHRHNRRRRRRTHRTHFVFTSITPSNDTVILTSRGLDAEILKLIPTFVYSPTTTHDGDSLECAVCLSEFEENEEGRTLPKCNHSFHTECIDMWFHSHSTCPLCRSPVNNPEISEPELEEIPIEIVIDSGESEQLGTSSSAPCSSCRNEGVEIGSGSGSGSSSSSSNSALTIEIQRREGNFNKGNLEEEIQGSPGGSHQNSKSPGSRILSLKRILSREKKPSMSNSMSYCSYVTEIDPEKGEEGEEEPEQVHPGSTTKIDDDVRERK